MVYNIIIIFCFLCLYNFIKVFILSKISSRRINITIKNSILFLLYNIVCYVNGILLDSDLSFIISFFWVVLLNKTTLSISFNKSFFNTTLLYLFLLLIDMVVWYFCNYNGIITISSFNVYTLLCFSFVVFVLNNRKFYNLIYNIQEYISYNLFFYIFCLCIMIVTNFLYNNPLFASNDKFFFLIIMMSYSLFLLLIFIGIRIYKKILYQETNLYNELITRHNTLNKNYKLLRHNLTNELLGLKCADKDNLDELIDDIIIRYKKDYDIGEYCETSKKGVEGIIDIKVKAALKEGISICVDNSLNLDDYTFAEEEYLQLCEVIGIVLDNAIEGVRWSEDKTIYVDIHNIDDQLCIKIINKFDAPIDIDEIYESSYSTKNRNSGFGLNYVKTMDTTMINTKIDIMDSLFIFTIYV